MPAQRSSRPPRTSVSTLPKRDPVAIEVLLEDLVAKVDNQGTMIRQYVDDSLEERKCVRRELETIKILLCEVLGKDPKTLPQLG